MANKDDDGSDVHSEQQTRTPMKVAWSIRQYRCGRLHPGVAQIVTAALAPLELAATITGAVADSVAGVGGGGGVVVGGCTGAGDGAGAGAGAGAGVGTVAGEDAASFVELDRALAMRSSSVTDEPSDWYWSS